jgi:biotin carboxyl carrier protein
MTEENDGILGNLPRSRPGVRSDKRASGKRAAAAGSTAGAPAKPEPKATSAPKPRAAAAKPRAATAKPPPPPPPPAPKSDDPITLAVKTAGQVAETGLKVASRMAGEVLRRLPRP